MFPVFCRNAWVPAAMFALYLAAVFFRPLMPIDETRYMSVAWEMLLHKGWFEPLTLNFTPYHHKPPLLFWLINMAWEIFGVSRGAALIPLVLSSTACLYLSGMLGRLLFPDVLKNPQRIYLIMGACVPFLIYNTIVMFDLTLTAFVLLTSIFIVRQSQNPAWKNLILAGFFIGLGVLTKGPVAYLYVLFPLLLAPWWIENLKKSAWYGGCFLIILISLLPVLCWLVPVLKHSDNSFAFWLLWNQTAGRVTGNFSDAHIHPFYFYFPLLPLLTLPWILFPAFWRKVMAMRGYGIDAQGMRFLICWLLPTFVCFCLISGKQPHYLVPFLPGVSIFLALCLRDLRTETLAVTFTTMVVLIITAQGTGARTFFKAYDLGPVSAYVRAHPDHDWAYVDNYHAEIGFLARLEKPVADQALHDLPQWFVKHPQGMAIIRYDSAGDVAPYKAIMDEAYRGRRMGVFSK